MNYVSYLGVFPLSHRVINKPLGIIRRLHNLRKLQLKSQKCEEIKIEYLNIKTSSRI